MAFTRRFFLSSVAAALAAPSVLQARTAALGLLQDKLEATKTPGLAALVIRDFRFERELVAGIRRLGSSAPVERGDRWHLGSDGKAMVATMIARLVERDVLRWDQSLADMLPMLAGSMHQDYRDVTLPELLSHRSGLPRDLSESQADFHYGFHSDSRPLPVQRLEYLERALSEPPVAPKRAAFSYSNSGYVLAAACAEHATQKSFAELMQSEVFSPLAMRSVSFEAKVADDEPVGHRDGRVADQTRDTLPPMFAPAGGMRMSLRDWGRFCIDQMQGEHGRGRLLTKKSYQFLHAPQGDTGFAALGWGFLPSAFGRQGPALFHSGSDGNWTAVVMLFCESGNGVVVAANAYESMGGDRAANEVMRAVVPRLAPPEVRSEPNPQ